MQNIVTLVEDFGVIFIVSLYVLPLPLFTIFVDTTIEKAIVSINSASLSVEKSAPLAITAVFSTVAPARVYAKDNTFITNVVYSSQSTGGVSQSGQDGEDGKNGADGEDGKNGQDGQDGQPGLNGKSIINVDSQSIASINIEATENRVKILDSEKTETINQDSYSIHTTTTPTSSEVVVETNLESTSSVDSSSNVLIALQEALSSLRLMLAKYVSVLF